MLGELHLEWVNIVLEPNQAASGDLHQRRGLRWMQWVLPFAVLAAALTLWALVAGLQLLPESVFPPLSQIARGFVHEAASGRLIGDIIASLFRVGVGFTLAILIGLPLGLWMGVSVASRTALLPYVNFLRNLSPLAWIPFAMLAFGIGDAPAIFLVFMAAVFPLSLSAMSAVASVPAVYFNVAREYEITGFRKWREIVLPAIAPQIITALRVTGGISWLVVVAAEMLGCQDGLGFAVWDSRNGLRVDLLVVAVIMIGLIGVLMDHVLVRLTFIPSVRWGYER